MNAQRAAEAALTIGLSDPELARGAGEGALVALDVTGGVAAMVGGSDYAGAPFNRAVSARRQPGSAFKPIVYATAFEAGYGPDDRFIDQPVTYGDWEPQNYGERYEGEMTLERAFARSSNAVAVQLSEAAGRGWVLRTARRLGIESPMQNTPAVALGAYEVTPLELGRAYLPFMNGGRAAQTYAILSIETSTGERLYAHDSATGPVVFASRVLNDMNRLFDASVGYGTSRNAAVEGRRVRGKTGTTNDFRDAWFAGWSGGLAAVVWMGNDDFTPTDEAVGGAGPARVFARFMAAAPDYPAALDALLGEVRPADPIASLIAGEALEEPTAMSEPQAEDEARDPIADLLGRIGQEG